MNRLSMNSKLLVFWVDISNPIRQDSIKKKSMTMKPGNLIPYVVY